MIGVGEGLALLSGFGYAAASVCIAKSAANKAGDNGALLSIIFTAGVALAVWVSSGAIQSGPLADGALQGAGWFALSGVLTIVLGRALFFQSVARIGATRAMAVNRLNPFFSVFLAAVLLGETVTLLGGLGMAMIGLSFSILIVQMLSMQAPSGRSAGEHVPSLLSYAFGPASALSYATGYIARKYGLNILPDPSLGTFIGAITGLAAYLCISLFSSRYLMALRTLWTGTTRWHVLAATFISVGQLAGFTAISYIEVSRVVMITSAEVFISMFLSVFVLKTESRPDSLTVIAALVATVGVVLITLS